ncbi:TIGR02611 family protein [Streptomyces ureilyticus]|uniref:TIGR02611 family protein n=1 Tax=Streptomyces ureilyticus TaxID=1775131 RepID=UPI002E281903|nr:TIGR02611 family protein [Streptomyces ureilyticus]
MPNADRAGGEVGEVTDEKPLGSRAPEFIRRSRPLHLGWRAGVLLIGLAVIVVGVILLPLPGPGWLAGWLAIFAGMALWATEFAWAQRILRWTKRKVTEAAHRALDPRVRRRNLALTAVGVAICAALVSVYVGKYGFVMPWGINR